MDKKEALLQQRDDAKKKAAQYENQVKILLNKQRDTERTARNHRLIVHGAIMEGESLSVPNRPFPSAWSNGGGAKDAGNRG